MALSHCDSAQRVSASQPEATPQVSTAATRFALKGQHRPALWNPFRVRVQTGYQPGAAFIHIRGFSCPRLMCASLSGSVAALTSSINANTFNPQMSPRTSFVDEPLFLLLGGHSLGWNLFGDGNERSRHTAVFGIPDPDFTVVASGGDQLAARIGA